MTEKFNRTLKITLQISSQRGGYVTKNCLSTVPEHSEPKSHPDVTFWYKNILERSISYEIIPI